jgi:hypothetical protein
MLKDVIEVKALPDCHIWVRFEDGVNGTVDLGAILKFTGIFSSLADPAQFNKVAVNAELGVVCWPNGADLDSDVLYSLVAKEPIALISPDANQDHFHA